LVFSVISERNASFGWQDWMLRRAFMLVPAQVVVKKYVESFKNFPPRGLPAGFSVGDALKRMQQPQSK
jgi:hypothetical protein